jgi:transcriptional regulator with XRE-family HTH domain
MASPNNYARGMSLREALVSNLSTLMQRHGLTQAAFAERVGVSQPTVSEWLNMSVWPTPESLERVALEFKIAPEELFRRRSA